MVLIMSTLLVLFMFIFVNALFYVVSLLFFVVSLLVWMASSNIMSVLMVLLITIVYVGAMMILIGYICAVCPNFIVESHTNVFFLIFTFCLINLVFTFISSVGSFKTATLSDYFFSTWGLLIFFILAFMLFFILLMVTSQYNIPQGPFRSLK